MGTRHAAACAINMIPAGRPFAGESILQRAGMTRGRMTPELAAEFAAAGVHRLVVLAPPDADGTIRAIESAASATADL